MILFINTSRTDLIHLKLVDDGKILAHKKNQEEYKHSELLLSLIDELMKDSGCKLEELGSIAIVSGPGAFSALRMGIATANTLAWDLKIPLIELTTDEADEEVLINNLGLKIEEFKTKGQEGYKFKPIVPKYGKEPNITKPKNK